MYRWTASLISVGERALDLSVPSESFSHRGKPSRKYAILDGKLALRGAIAVVAKMLETEPALSSQQAEGLSAHLTGQGERVAGYIDVVDLTALAQHLDELSFEVELEGVSDDSAMRYRAAVGEDTLELVRGDALSARTLAFLGSLGDLSEQELHIDLASPSGQMGFTWSRDLLSKLRELKALRIATSIALTSEATH